MKTEADNNKLKSKLSIKGDSLEQYNDVSVHRCNLCEKTFTKRDNVTIHVKSVHGNEKLYRCNFCEEKFKF